MKRYTMKANRPIFGKIQFDSQAEYDFFFVLKSLFPLDRIKVHQPILIRPENQWFPVQNWKVDFTITGVDELQGHELFLEYKGIIEDSFKEKLKSLAHFRPTVYANLVIVCPTVKVITRGLISVTPMQVEAYVKHKQFKELVSDCKKERM